MGQSEECSRTAQLLPDCITDDDQESLNYSEITIGIGDNKNRQI